MSDLDTRRRGRLVVGGVGLLGLFGLAACGGGSHSYVPPPDPYASSGNHGAGTATAISPIASTSGAFNATWQGYAYRFSFTATYGHPREDLTHSAPGDAELSFDWHVSLRISNESGGRTAPPPGRLFNIEGAWPVNSAICRLGSQLDPETNPVRDPVGGPNDWTDPDPTDDANFPYCLMALGGTSPDAGSAADISPTADQVVDTTQNFSEQLDQEFVEAAIPALQEGPSFWVSSPFGLSAPPDQDDSACGNLLWASVALASCDVQVG